MTVKDDIEKLGFDLRVALDTGTTEEKKRLSDELYEIANSHEKKADSINDDNDPVKREASEIAYWALEAVGDLEKVIRVCRKAKRLYSAAAAAGRLGRPRKAIDLYEEQEWQDCGARVAREIGLKPTEVRLFTRAIQNYEAKGWYAGAGDLAEEADMPLVAIECYKKARDDYRNSQAQTTLAGKLVEAEHYGNLAALMNRKINENFAKSG